MENYKKIGNVYKFMDDDKVIDLKQFKEAKVHLENLEHINKVLDLGIRSLNHFQVYTPAYETVYYLQGQKILVEAYIKKMKKILGKKNFLI